MRSAGAAQSIFACVVAEGSIQRMRLGTLQSSYAARREIPRWRCGVVGKFRSSPSSVWFPRAIVRSMRAFSSGLSSSWGVVVLAALFLLLLVVGVAVFGSCCVLLVPRGGLLAFLLGVLWCCGCSLPGQAGG